MHTSNINKHLLLTLWRKQLNLKYNRKRLKKTQAQLAKKLGMTKNSYARMERGETPLLLKTELAIRYLLLMNKK